MKDILGHKSRTMPEIIEILEKGSYCCPTLPHYRYNRVKDACRELKKMGLIEKSGVTNEGVNYRATPLFKEWKEERDSGLTTKQPVKWVKERKKYVLAFLVTKMRFS